jgi:hypothetical protein
VGVHDIGSEDIQADEMLLAGEADFNLPIAGVARTVVLHRFFEVGEQLLARAYHRVLKLARMIAGLAEAGEIAR